MSHGKGQVGTALKRIFQQIGINPKRTCNCVQLSKQMDEWGIEGCRLRRTRIVTALKESRKKWGWFDTFDAALKVATSSLAVKAAQYPFNPLLGIVDEAIEQAQWALDAGVTLYPINAVRPFTDRVVRNLIYFIYPVKGPEWRRNVELILRRRHLFNGKRIVAIATDANTDHVETVHDALQDLRCDFLHFQNHIGEVVAFESLLNAVESLGPNDITYYAHAKGVTKQGNPGLEGAVQKWTNAMHESLLDGIDEVEQVIQEHAFVGCFRALGKPFGRQYKRFYGWHFPGTFYWFRNADVFSLPHWRSIPQAYYGAELWPGMMVPVDHSAAIVADRVGITELYMPNEWDAISQPRVDAWRERRIGRRKGIMHQSCYDACAAFIESHIADKADLSIADIGAYDVNGCVRPLFSRDGWTYTGFDVTPGPNVDVVLASEYDWSNVPSHSFDVVVSLNTVEHVRQPWKWMREVARICKPGGLIFLSVPHTIPYHAYPIDCWRVWPEGMRGLLDDAGIEPLSVAVASIDTIAIGRIAGG